MHTKRIIPCLDVNRGRDRYLSGGQRGEFRRPERRGGSGGDRTGI